MISYTLSLIKEVYVFVVRDTDAVNPVFNGAKSNVRVVVSKRDASLRCRSLPSQFQLTNRLAYEKKKTSWTPKYKS